MAAQRNRSETQQEPWPSRGPNFHTNRENAHPSQLDIDLTRDLGGHHSSNTRSLTRTPNGAFCQLQKPEPGKGGVGSWATPISPTQNNTVPCLPSAIKTDIYCGFMQMQLLITIH